MSPLEPSAQAAPPVELLDLAPPASNLAREVLGGLLRTGQKTLPCRLFYDERGSQLFDLITRQPEYYPTRTEIAILKQHGEGIAHAAGPGALILELGSGSSTKTQLLLDHLDHPAGYAPLDICREHLAMATQRLTVRYPHLPIRALCADYNRPVDLKQANLPPHRRRIAYFPGSTIGNFHPPAARAFLARIASLVRCGSSRGGMIIGVDAYKHRAILEAAYNDAAGVTAAFNLNALRHLNAALDADFDLHQWHHRALFNAEAHRIEMHLVSATAQSVHLGGKTIRFKRGETILTECSYKYGCDEFTSLAQAAGWTPRNMWQDAAQLFRIFYLQAQ